MTTPPTSQNNVPDASEGVVVLITPEVATITLNRPDQRNPLNWATVKALRRITSELEQNDTVRVVCVRGAGGNFSAGGDMRGYVDLYRCPNDFEAFLRHFMRMLDQIETSKKIYVALIEGYCVAGGLELLLACDVVLASSSAQIGCGHLKFGQLPGAGGSQRLPRTIGALRAKYLMLSAEILSAAEAERIGLVSKVIDDVEFDAAASKFVGRLTSASPLGIRGVKHLVDKGMRMELPAALEFELKYVHDYATRSEDATEGLMAFSEKRKPRFTCK